MLHVPLGVFLNPNRCSKEDQKGSNGSKEKHTHRKLSDGPWAQNKKTLAKPMRQSVTRTKALRYFALCGEAAAFGPPDKRYASVGRSGPAASSFLEVPLMVRLLWKWSVSVQGKMKCDFRCDANGRKAITEGRSRGSGRGKGVACQQRASSRMCVWGGWWGEYGRLFHGLDRTTTRAKQRRR
jgi:hypothetical protein